MNLRRMLLMTAAMLAVLLFAIAVARGQSKPAGESPASTQAAAPANDQRPTANGAAELTADEKKDLTILNQAMVIQQQRFQLLQAELAKTQQEYARLAAERGERLAKAKAAHKWGEEVSCNPEELACARVPAQEGKK